MSTLLTEEQSAKIPERIPELEQGDRLTRAEFERRYEAMPSLKRAELIEGVVFMPSPVRLHRHARPHADLLGWMLAYRTGTPGVIVGDNGSVRLADDNEPQPDAFMMIEPALGGQAQIDADDYVNGAPELVAEVASSTASIDLNTKLIVYQRCGVREYLVWRVLDWAFDWFVLEDGHFKAVEPVEGRVYQSRVFPGLWLDVSALVYGDLKQVMRMLSAGMETPEHAAFVQQLAQKRS